MLLGSYMIKEYARQGSDNMLRQDCTMPTGRQHAATRSYALFGTERAAAAAAAATAVGGMETAATD